MKSPHSRRRTFHRIILILVICGVGVLISWAPRWISSRAGSVDGSGYSHTTDLEGDRALAEKVRGAVSEVVDPEVGISVTSLGLVRRIEVTSAGRTRITMILTSPFCPLAGYLKRQILQAASEVEGVGPVEVIVDRNTRWSPDMMDEQATPRWGLFKR
jgi:metal-sulfur cluster biosynthetic enzyme